MDPEITEAYNGLVPRDQRLIAGMILTLSIKDGEIKNCVSEIRKLLARKDANDS